MLALVGLGIEFFQMCSVPLKSNPYVTPEEEAAAEAALHRPPGEVANATLPAALPQFFGTKLFQVAYLNLDLYSTVGHRVLPCASML